jgi:cytoskeletal protein CcmA (bactofilin family)
VDGEFEGRLYASDRLVIGQAGILRADLEAREIVVSGRVEGKLIAQERVELQTGARVEGEVWAQSLVIADGVRFSGNCRMGEEAKEHWRTATTVRGREGAESRGGRESSGTPLSVLDAARARNH